MRIAVTGIGIITALGRGYDANASALSGGISGLRFSDIYTPGRKLPLGIVDLPSSSGDELSRNTLLGIEALKECLSDAGVSFSQLKECSLINGTTVGGIDLIEKNFVKWQSGDFNHIEVLKQNEVHGITDSLVKKAGLKDGLTVSTACSAALNAIIHAAMLLCSGEVSRVIAGGTEALTRFHVNGFAALDILSDEVCRPFQPDRNGINLGEGAAYLMLENEDAALKRSAKIYGYIAGYGNSCDAYHFTASSPEGTGAYLAMTKAISVAGLRASDIEYVNAHGTATENNDESEMHALQRVFADGLPFMESTKPLTGHTTSASGSIEAVFTIMRMRERGCRYAMTNAFGFGGNDSSLILSTTPCELSSTGVVKTKTVADVTVQKDVEWKSYMPLMQGRRLSPIMRAAVVASKMALEEGDVNNPDAIIVGTRYGVLSLTWTLLKQLLLSDEGGMSPSLFMLSTHNSVAGVIATTLQCNGFNATYSCGMNSNAEAANCAEMVIKSGDAKCVLVCCFDETDEELSTYASHIGYELNDYINAKLIVCSD